MQLNRISLFKELPENDVIYSIEAGAVMKDTCFIINRIEREMPEIVTENTWHLTIICKRENDVRNKMVIDEIAECDISFDFDHYYENSDYGEKVLLLFEALENGISKFIDHGMQELIPIIELCRKYKSIDFHNKYVWKQRKIRENLLQIIVDNQMKKTDITATIRGKENKILKEETIATLSPDIFLYKPYLKKWKVDMKNKVVYIYGESWQHEQPMQFDFSDIDSLDTNSTANKSDNKKETETAKTDNRETAKVPEQSSHWKSFVFWEILDLCDWDHEGDDDKVLKPVIKYLSKQSDAFLFSFHDQMTELLYQLDTKELYSQCVEQTGSESDDLFLYSRCVALINGKEFYKKALEGETPQIWDMEFKSLLYIAGEAWAKKHKKEPGDYPYDTRLSYETGSSGWEG